MANSIPSCGVRGCGMTLLVTGIVGSSGWLGGVSHNLSLLATLELWWLSCRIVASQTKKFSSRGLGMLSSPHEFLDCPKLLGFSGFGERNSEQMCS